MPPPPPAVKVFVVCAGTDLVVLYRNQSMTDQEDSVDRKCSAAPAEHEAPAGMAGSNIASGGSSKGRSAVPIYTL